MPALMDALHGAAIDGSLPAWSAALERIADAFGAGSAYLQPCGGGTSWGPQGPIAIRADPAWGRSYVEYYGALDPVIPVLTSRFKPGEAVSGRQTIEPMALWRTEYGHDWCRPQGMVETALGLLTHDDLDPDGGWGALVLSRGRGAEPFDASELRRLKALLPHVRRAVEAGLRLGAVAAERDALAAALEHVASRAAMVLDARRRVVFASRAAEALLAGPGAPLERAADGTLGAPARAPARVHAEFQRLLAAAAGTLGGLRTGGSMRLPGMGASASGKAAHGTQAAALEVLPLGGAGGSRVGPKVLVLIEAPQRPPALPSVELCHDRFGLTPAEARAALLLAERGTGSKALARELGVSPATVRTHLQRVLEKTGMHSRAALVALLLHGRGGRPG